MTNELDDRKRIGGASVQGDTNVGHDFIGRDKIENKYNFNVSLSGLPPDSMPQKFSAENLTTEQRDLLLAAAKSGEFQVVKTQQRRPWIRSGGKNFSDDKDPAFNARYFKAFELLRSYGLIEHDDGVAYLLTADGFEIAYNLANRK
jgi:hypothetical protein